MSETSGTLDYFLLDPEDPSKGQLSFDDLVGMQPVATQLGEGFATTGQPELADIDRHMQTTGQQGAEEVDALTNSIRIEQELVFLELFRSRPELHDSEWFAGLLERAENSYKITHGEALPEVHEPGVRKEFLLIMHTRVLRRCADLLVPGPEAAPDQD